MYYVASWFDVRPERHQEFIDAALQDRRDSLANEPGTRRLDLIKDEERSDRFFLDEAYEDEAAFNLHKCGPYYERFFDVVGKPAEGSIKGTRVDDTAQRRRRHAQRLHGWMRRVSSLFEADKDGAVEPEHPENFIGRVRMIDQAALAGLTGAEVVAVHFDAGARTRPHVHPTEQLLYFVRGNGFVAFPGLEEQVVDEGDIVIVPACELHMHGATTAGPTCHMAARLPGKTNWKPHVPAEWREFAEGHSWV